MVDFGEVVGSCMLLAAHPPKPGLQRPACASSSSVSCMGSLPVSSSTTLLPHVAKFSAPERLTLTISTLHSPSTHKAPALYG